MTVFHSEIDYIGLVLRSVLEWLTLCFNWKSFLKTGLKYFLYLVIGTSILMSISWSLYPERSAGIYAKMVNKMGLKRIEWANQTCYHDTTYAFGLSDNVTTYLEESFNKGTGKLLNKTRDIGRYVRKGVLVEIQPNEYCVLDTMYYSYPYLTPVTKLLIDTIGERFHRKLENTTVQCAKFTLTSMLRTTSSIKRLRKRNKNSIKNSAHLHGTTFDISYSQFYGDRIYSRAEVKYLADVLAETIWELRKENKCWAKHEVWQTCFHVVSR